MILFQEQLATKDDTLDPAYFARRPQSAAASSGLSTNEIKEIIKELIQENPDWISGVDLTSINDSISDLNTQITNINNITNEINGKIEILENKTVHKELTQAQYDALSAADKAADIEYFISG